MNRKYAPSLIALVSAALLLSACAGTSPGSDKDGAGNSVPASVRSAKFDWGTFNLADRIVQRLEKNEPIRIASSYQGTGIPVAGAQNRQGLERACKEDSDRLKLECRLIGPATTDFPAQLAELETLLNGNQVDCLVLQSGEPNAFAAIIDRYVDAGIPVFTQNGDVVDSKRFAYFALNEIDAAKINAETTIAVMKDMGIETKEVAMGSGNPTAPWAQGRLEGFETGMKKGLTGVKFFNDATSGLPTGANYTVDEVVSSVGPFLAAHPNVNLFFHTDQGVEGVGQVIRSSGKTGQVWTSGFNVSMPILDQIEKGEVLVTIDQGFDNQAAAGANACVDFLTTGKLPAEQLAYLKPIVVTKSGINGSMTAAEAKKRLEEAK